jgi:hypothetical protein
VSARHHDFAGRLLVDPAQLSRVERIDELRRLAGTLQGDGKPDPRASTWLGRAIGDWLHGGGDFAEHLGILPPRGSHATAQNLLRQEARDRLLLQLSVKCGGDTKALRILHGDCPVPPMLSELVESLRGAPCSQTALNRARRRLSRHGP